MSEVKIQTVPRVYLVDKNVNRTSMWHTAYVGEPGNPDILHRLEFFAGVARSVPLAVFERFRDAGIVTTERPRRPRRDDDDED